jgi:hypothetical protein
MNEEKVVKKFGAFSTIGYFPLKDQVIVRPIRVNPLPKKTDLVLPDSVSKESKNNYDVFDKYPYQAIVVAVGPGFNKETPTTVRPGMRVYMAQGFEQSMTRNFIWNKVNYYKCQEGNIAGIADDDTDNPLLEKEEIPAMKALKQEPSAYAPIPIGQPELKEGCEKKDCDCGKEGASIN